MDIEKLLMVLDWYDQMLKKMGVPVTEHDFEQSCQSRELALAHIRSMIPQIRQFIREGRMEKVNRWLGFIQGILFSFGIYTIEEERDHNRMPT